MEREIAPPTEFAGKGEYPNPLRASTRLQFDLPYRVGVEVFYVKGWRALLQPPVDLSASYARELSLKGVELPSGAYPYRLAVDAPKGQSPHTGHSVRVR